jgi:hypothetical protein
MVRLQPPRLVKVGSVNAGGPLACLQEPRAKIAYLTSACFEEAQQVIGFQCNYTIIMTLAAGVIVVVFLVTLGSAYAQGEF